MEHIFRAIPRSINTAPIITIGQLHQVRKDEDSYRFERESFMVSLS